MAEEASIDIATLWYLIVGTLLVSMAVLESLLQRLPLSPAMFYLLVGFLLGPSGFALIEIDPGQHAGLLTIITEIALLISLFTVGLKLRVPLSDRIWRLPVRLGLATMAVTMILLVAIGVFLLHFPLGAAIVLAAILAPTDPVLASDVQIEDVSDRDRIRFSLSGEGGLNDGVAFPFLMVGLGLLAVPKAFDYTQPAALFRVAWEFFAGLGGGWLIGLAIGRLILYLRRRYRIALGMEEFLTLGMIALSYGMTHAIHGNGVIAVFMTGLALRRIEHAASGVEAPSTVIGAVSADSKIDVATDPRKAPAYMTETVLDFNRQLEHIIEFAMVLLLGAMLSGSGISSEGMAVAALLFFVVRPAAVVMTLKGLTVTPLQRAMMAWLGIRGIGSLYYLTFALQYHWLPQLADRFTALVLTIVAASIVLHGFSARSLMKFYYRQRSKEDLQ